MSRWRVTWALTSLGNFAMAAGSFGHPASLLFYMLASAAAFSAGLN